MSTSDKNEGNILSFKTARLINGLLKTTIYFRKSFIDQSVSFSIYLRHILQNSGKIIRSTAIF
jgi:hypothetical protein